MVKFLFMRNKYKICEIAHVLYIICFINVKFVSSLCVCVIIRYKIKEIIWKQECQTYRSKGWGNEVIKPNILTLVRRPVGLELSYRTSWRSNLIDLSSQNSQTHPPRPPSAISIQHLISRSAQVCTTYCSINYSLLISQIPFIFFSCFRLNY